MNDAAETAAGLLLAARRERRQCPALPEDCRPRDLDAAYAVQARHVAGLVTEYRARPIGYKVGCTNKTAQAQLGIEAPFSGVMLDRFMRKSPAELPGDALFMRVIEAEFAFRLGRDLRAAHAPFAREDVRAAIAAVVPAIEIVDSRFAEWTKVGAFSLIADQGATGYWIAGAEITAWRDLDLPGHHVRLFVDGKASREGIGGNVLGDPLASVIWLANDLARRGGGLHAGDVVSTGTCIDVYFAAPGEQILADFGALGRVEVKFTK
jgi:2-keto-4-pentenoate hydratase